MLSAAIIIGAAIAAGAGIYSVYKSSKNAEELNKKSERFEREKLDYQKYLNANQNQIMASDSLKAGINPIAMSGGSLTAGNASLNLQQTDYSGIANAGATIGSSMISAASNQKINEMNINANEPYVQAAADKEQAQADLAKQQYDQNYELHQENLEKAKIDKQRAQEEYEIIKRKNKGQEDDGTYDGKPVSSDSTSVKIGPVSYSKSKSGQSASGKDYINSKEYGQFISSKISDFSKWTKLESIDGDFDTKALSRLDDEGFKRLGVTSNNGINYYLYGNSKGQYITVYKKK